jgi:hypothetical protein
MSKILDIEVKEEGSALIVARHNGEIQQGSERTLAVSGGVKAQLVRTKEGKLVVEKFIFDKNRFDKDAIESWVKKNETALSESLKTIQENMPKGSFSDITMRVQQSVSNSNLFPLNDYGQSSAYVSWVFPDYVVVNYNGEYWKIPYTDADGRITLGEMSKVDMTFIEEAATKENRRLESLAKPNTEIGEGEFARLAEKETNDEKKELVAVLIEAGKNFNKRRYYPKDTIREAAPLFGGLKMFMDHPTAKEDQEKPERSVKGWVATIVESWYEDGKAMGRIRVHDDEFWKLLKDPVYREHIGISINAFGRSYVKTIDGERMEVVEKITNPASVDWVTEPGARGRVAYLLESMRKEGETKMLNTITVAQLRESRKDLVDAIEADIRTRLTGESEAKIKEAVDKAVEKAVKETREKIVRQNTRSKKFAEAISASKLPAKSQEKVAREGAAIVESDCTDEEFGKKIEESIKAELEYVKGLGVGVKVGTGEGAQEEKSVRETATADLSKRLGFAEEKKV